MVSKLNRAMQRNPLLTEAMTRAYVFADASAAGEVDHVEKLIDSMFARPWPTVNRPRTSTTSPG
ncbi:HTH-type transcriptional repressor KstR [Mycobacterium xenopi 4042]|uniref:HTH-type transcriptional repressor KstR n=1 Tax=Mycobacterium xenopi 4042 TaxID=1299334 RepID=X7ZW93_MYCXE|nr:HTH-type transcriptional repressor KstR [Mycobacterium xenopi 4042]